MRIPRVVLAPFVTALLVLAFALDDVTKATIERAHRMQAKGDVVGAQDVLVAALTSLMEAKAPDDDAAVVELRFELGSVLYELRDYAAAKAYLVKAREAHRRRFGAEDPDKKNPDWGDLSTAAVLDALGNTLDRLNEFHAERDAYKHALAIKVRLLGEEDSLVTAAALIGTAIASKTVGELGNALKMHQRALTIQQRVLGPMHRDLAVTHHNIGNVLLELGRDDLALAAHEKALEIRLKHEDKDPISVAMSYNALGEVKRHQGDHKAALDYFTRTLTIQAAQLGEGHEAVTGTHNNIGVAHFALKDYPKALDHHERALAVRLAIHGDEDHIDVADSHMNLAVAYKKLGDIATAFEHALKDLQIKRSLLGDEHPETASSSYNIGLLYKQNGNDNAARVFVTKAHKLFQALFGDKHANTLKAAKTLSDWGHAVPSATKKDEL